MKLYTIKYDDGKQFNEDPIFNPDQADEDYEMFENMYYGGNDYDGCL